MSNQDRKAKAQAAAKGKVFEQYAGETVAQLAQDGKIRLRVHLKTVIEA